MSTDLRCQSVTCSHCFRILKKPTHIFLELHDKLPPATQQVFPEMWAGPTTENWLAEQCEVNAHALSRDSVFVDATTCNGLYSGNSAEMDVLALIRWMGCFWISCIKLVLMEILKVTIMQQAIINSWLPQRGAPALRICIAVLPYLS